jgi:hypothetical protein
MARKNTAKTPCECSRYSVLINIRTGNDGNLVWDQELTTGCPKTLTGRDFAPGHDAKLKGFLIRAGIEGHEVCDDQGISCTAEAMAGRYGFAHMVREGVENGKFKRAEAAERRKAREHKAELRNDRENEKAERKLAKAAKVVETTHDGNSARQERELAALVAAEEAKFAEQQAAQADERPEPEWDDEPQAVIIEEPMPESVEMVEAKVGRWTYLGEVRNGWFVYSDRKGNKKSTQDFELV